MPCTTYVRAWAELPPRHADYTLISLSERGAPAVSMSDGSQQFHFECPRPLALDLARGRLLEPQVGECRWPMCRAQACASSYGLAWVRNRRREI
jgi:hypothetical protein